MNQKLVEICLRVRDIDATLDFYTNLFDFEIASQREFPKDKFDLIYLNLPGSSVQIELTGMSTLFQTNIIRCKKYLKTFYFPQPNEWKHPSSVSSCNLTCFLLTTRGCTFVCSFRCARIMF